MAELYSKIPQNPDRPIDPATVGPPPPPQCNTANLGTDKKAAVFGNLRYSELYIITKPLFGTWKWAVVLGGGGIWRGGIGGGGGDDCIDVIVQDLQKHGDSTVRVE